MNEGAVDFVHQPGGGYRERSISTETEIYHQHTEEKTDAQDNGSWFDGPEPVDAGLLRICRRRRETRNTIDAHGDQGRASIP